MPFEFGPVAPKKIAIIGAGISGMGAAHLLSKAHKVTLFEADNRLGGHARTVLAGKNLDQPVDTGFIVFNYDNYPRMTKLFEVLDVPVAKSDMSFGISVDGGKLEYCLESVNSIYGQRRNIFRPKFHAMIRDLLHFNKNAEEEIDDPQMSLRNLLDKMKMGDWFRDHYILPFGGAIWSTSTGSMLDFPAENLLRFFRNHKLLSWDSHQWFTVDGGSIEYVKRLESSLRKRRANIRLNSPVKSVNRKKDGVWVRSYGGQMEHFDTVVFACHSDQVLEVLENPTKEELKNLGDIKYQPNEAILHSDPIVMPKRKRCWGSWIYASDEAAESNPVGVSYWMNRLQNIKTDEMFFQSLNPARTIRDDLIYDQKTFMHPVFDSKAFKAQEEIQKFQGRNNTWYCGAYLRNGFHEDGYSSAVDVAEHMGMIPTWA